MLYKSHEKTLPSILEVKRNLYKVCLRGKQVGGCFFVLHKPHENVKVYKFCFEGLTSLWKVNRLEGVLL